MSLFGRIGSSREISLLTSITENLHVLFSNRVDVYWSYDSANQKAFGIHTIFRIYKFSDKFLLELARGIELWEPRIKRAVCSWSFGGTESPILNVRCVLKEFPSEIRSITFPYKDL